MLIDFSQVLYDKAGEGEALKVPAKDGKGEETLTLGAACRKALTTAFLDGKEAGDILADRYFLAARIKTATEPIEIRSEEAADMKQLIHKAFKSPVMNGECFPLLDGKKEANKTPVFPENEKD